jgi:hypothetical protein
VAIERIALRRRILTSFVILSASAISGCHGHDLDLSDRTEEEPPPLAARVDMADPRTARQLISGWWSVEDSTWRWTARKFAVILRPPIGAAKAGAVLRCNFTLPEVVFSHCKQVTLSASMQGRPLAPETYTHPGAAPYTRAIPADILSVHSVRIDFELDKAMPPSQADSRELGLIARGVSLEPR